MSNLSDGPQKINGLAGITLAAYATCYIPDFSLSSLTFVFSIIQAFATLASGFTIGLIFIWKLGLVGLGKSTMLVSLLDLVLMPDTACVPFLMSVGYIRLVSTPSSLSFLQRVDICIQRVIVLKDQSNKKAHEESAQLACEAAASIRTVASLTREDDCLEIYSKSLEGPLRRSSRTAVWSNLLFSISQAFSFFIISLVFWYGSILVSNLEFNTKQFFTGLMVMYHIAKSHKCANILIDSNRELFLVLCRPETCLPSFRTSPRHVAQPRTLFSYLIHGLKLTPNRLKAKFQRMSEAISASKMFTSVIQRVPVSVYFAVSTSL